MKNLSEGLAGTQEAQNTTLKQLQAQQAQASQLESSMAHMTSLFAGAKRKEQMEGIGTGKKVANNKLGLVKDTHKEIT